MDNLFAGIWPVLKRRENRARITVVIPRRIAPHPVKPGWSSSPESVVAFDWNQWSPCAGTGGRLRLESTVAFSRNTQLAYLPISEREKRSAERDKDSLKRLYPFFTGRNLGSLTAVDVRAYIEDRLSAGVQAGTINREIGLLSAALNYARREWDWSVPNPAMGRRLKEPVGRVRWISKPEAERLVAAARTEPQAPHLPDFILLGLNTGMRKGEMLGLDWQRVDLESRLIYLGAGHQKNGRPGSVPLNKEAYVAIQARAEFRKIHCPSSPWVFCDRRGDRIACVKKSFASACRKAGLEDFHQHDLRHTCAAWLVQAGVPLIQVRELL